MKYRTISTGAIAKGTAAIGALTFGALAIGALYLAKLVARGSRVSRLPVNPGTAM